MSEVHTYAWLIFDKQTLGAIMKILASISGMSIRQAVNLAILYCRGTDKSWQGYHRPSAEEAEEIKDEFHNWKEDPEPEEGSPELTFTYGESTVPITVTATSELDQVVLNWQIQREDEVAQKHGLSD